MIEVGDLIELTTDIPKKELRCGARGTVVHCHGNDVYEVEFTDDLGETINFLALHSRQFIIVWRAETRQWVSIAEQAADLIAKLPDETAKEIFDFARFLSARIPFRAPATS